ncbi:MAG: M20 family metallopeptidase [Intestinimonas massiliensis]|uniref:M20 metallopeptidase family protein n=1 Tax=Intestinimonas TaxID=1392389 RepID=UPI00242ED3BC|nr:MULTISPECIES: M20 family metallopeptidase [Intestinimonas]MCI5562351.1 M20 family metallopeptidase [Intestinimonas massiliensis (ex Afouda et al. 2020)]MDY5339745.1 M20 family metallopeptidase [Intestinimonas sp.]
MTPRQLLEEAAQLKESMVFNRRYLHVHAETGFDLKDTYAFVKKALIDMGYEPLRCGKAGLVALAGGKKSGKVFLIRADMDALPIQEAAEVDFASANGSMHACGHDMHTAMLLGAAKLLKAHEDELEGTVKLMFQPAEEIFEGSRDMIQAGLLQNPAVDGALMIHVMAGMPFEAGTVIVSAPGVSAPAADYFEISVQGTGCHGSMPYAGVDPLNAAAHILIALQEIHARELAMDDRAVLTFGTMNAGTAANVIPDMAVMAGSIRTFDEEIRALIKERMVQIADGIARSFRAEANVSFGSGCPTLVNDKDLCICAERYVKELLGGHKAFSVSDRNAMSAGQKPSKSAGSEDFAYVSQEVPSIMLALAAGQPEKGYGYPQHHPMVRFDEDALVSGSAVYAYTAMRWLEEHK